VLAPPPLLVDEVAPPLGDVVVTGLPEPVVV
jgi:hypothetical protein